MATKKIADWSNTGRVTPNGGVRTEIYFLDNYGNAIDETLATHAEVVEFNAKGEQVARIYASLGRRGLDEAVADFDRSKGGIG